MTDTLKYKPLVIQYAIIATLKRLYPKQFQAGMKTAEGRRKMFAQVIGSDKVWPLLLQKTPIQWNLRALHEKERKSFFESAAAICSWNTQTKYA